jgi:glycosyltransferase involved in cell wall biosynthesis
LAATLDTLTRFPEVLVIDTGSIDATRKIVTNYANVRMLEEPFQGFGKLHNLAAKRASHDWILSIDSDEILSLELIDEILDLPLDPKAVYSLNRCNYFQGKWIKCCSGWYPDPVIRLYHRNATRFTDSAVHEAVIADGLEVVHLRGKLFHTPYRSIENFLSKMQLYTTLFAEENVGQSSSLGKALWRGFAAFMKNYFFKRGFLGGKEGFIISLYNAHTTYYKYLKLAYPVRESVAAAQKPSQELAPQDKADSLS